jgi:WD40 repeat protein
MSAINLSAAQENELLYVGFNQDYGCFACGTDTGFRIYNCNPFKETFRRHFSQGGIGIVEMLFRCNILALVGGGKVPRYPKNKVMIWDDHQNRCIGELSFRSEVRAVKLRRDRVVVVLENKIYVYNFADLKLVDHVETIKNSRGLVALCPSSANMVLACPGLIRGHVRVELYDSRRSTFIPAHETDLAAMALNLAGTRLATASEKGTLIRIFDTQTGQLQQELRRGADKADIYSLSFDPHCKHLACSSDKGTVHIFKLTGSTASDAVVTDAAARGAGAGEGGGKGGGQNAPPAAPGRGAGAGAGDAANNPTSSLRFMRGLLPKYFSSEWSFAQFRVPHARTICAFGADEGTLIAVSADGTFRKTCFLQGGDCDKVAYSKFVKHAMDDEWEVS